MEKIGKILVITDEVTSTMYRAIGCEVIVVSTPSELVKNLEANIMREDLALILISKELSEPSIDDVEKIIKRSPINISMIPSYGKVSEPVNLRKQLLSLLGVG